jgi:putative flippase GtrA
MTLPLKLKHRLFYFIGIGGFACLVHLTSVFSLVTFLHIPVLIANPFGFLIAFNVSFLGHKHLTFMQMQNKKILRLPHFFMVAASAGVLNEAFYYLILRYTHLNYLVALILVLGFVSMYTFAISQLWACR